MTDLAETLRQAIDLHRAGDAARAEELYRSILQAGHNHVAAANLGVILARRGETADAERWYRAALAYHPDFGEAYVNLANLLVRQGRIDEAIANFRGALTTSNPPAIARRNLWQLLFDHNRNADAVDELERHTLVHPHDVEALNLLGLALVRLGRSADAAAVLRRALALNPRHALAHNSLALALDMAGQPDAAVEHLETAIALSPGRPEAMSNLGLIRLEQGQAEAAVDLLQKSLAIAPKQPLIHSNLLLARNYLPGPTLESVRDEHIRWAAAFADGMPAIGELHRPDPTGILHIGYVSADFRSHPVAAYIGGVLAAHDRKAFRATCYSSVARPDAVTAELQTKSDGWRDIVGISDTAAAELIRSDRVDVLVDLCGHTSRNRLGVFSRRPAPVLVTHFGYPNTTGLKAMAYRLTDRFADPDGADIGYVEQLVRLPEFAWCWTPPPFSPIVGPLPADSTGFVTFGSLNNAAKLTSEVIAAWARILVAVPDSRLIVLGGPSAAAQRRLLERFGERGIVGRVEVLPRMQHRNYYSAYNRIDLGLDPFPYNGGVTTCDANWMGVPVICLEGGTYAARQGAAISNVLGLDAFVARSIDEYVELAVTRAMDRDKLREARRGSRDRLANSAICDVARFTRHLEAAYRTMIAASSVAAG